MSALELLVCFLAVVVSAPAVLLLVQVTAARLALRLVVNVDEGATRQCGGFALGPGTIPLATGAGSPERARLAVLIPAHNEEVGLRATLESVLVQLRPDDRILVVADNCQDKTAEVASRTDVRVQVTERSDASRRGKGYALDHGVRVMEAWSSAPDLVVIIDADCTLGPGALDELARSVKESGRPAQALYLMHVKEATSLGQRVAEFAWILKNHVRAAGMHAMGLPCQLMGSGMAFPWHVLRDAPLATGHLVEDMKLGADLAAIGLAPRFCEVAVVHSDFPIHEEGIRSQRERWEQGHLSVIAAQGLPSLWRALRRRSLPEAALAADLCVPPLASLALAQLGVLAIAAALAVSAGRNTPVVISLCGCVSFALAVLLAWDSHARGVISAQQLMAIPSYVAAKLPLYAATLAGKRSAWTRTRRDRE